MFPSTALPRITMLLAAALALAPAAHAYTVYTDLASWQVAVAAAPACQGHSIYTDDFNQNIPQAQWIAFPSGVTSTNSDLLGGLHSALPQGAGIAGDPSNSVQNGHYVNSLDIRSAPDKVNSSEARWILPANTCAFALDFYGVDLLTNFASKLGIIGDFDGPGAGGQFINVVQAAPGGAAAAAFFGVVGTADFREIYFQVALDVTPTANLATFGIDNAHYASRYPTTQEIPTLGGWGLALLAGLLVLAAAAVLRRRVVAG